MIFSRGWKGENIEIGDGVKPEDVSEEDAPIIKYVHSVIKDALERRASDIHMEPLEKKFRVRFRVDGKLQEQPDPPKRLQPSILSHQIDGQCLPCRKACSAGWPNQC